MTALRKLCAALACALILFVAACGRPAPTADPHEGMVEVPDGAGGMMWVPLIEGVGLSELEPGDFTAAGGFVNYTGDAYKVRRGIDVSFYQGDVDWEAVRADGIEFAILRAGYRGYSLGQLYEDERFREYAEGALAAGIEIGAYFFSQATSVREAREEAELTLSVIRNFDITLPVAFDWEHIGYEEARTDALDGGEVTDCALEFCSVIREAGYEPAVYMYRKLGYFTYDLARLGDAVFWVGAAGAYPDFLYAHEIWQYSFTGRVDGIETDVDLNLQFLPVE